MSAANQLARPITVAEFLAATLEGDRQELIEGMAHAMAPAAPRHGAIAAQLARLLGNHLDGLPHCQVVIEPGVQPRVRADINVRIPDLAITCTPIGPDDRLLREPTVLIEVLSPSNQKDTWGNVWAYTTIPSVRDILVLYTAEPRADLLTRQPDGTWPDNPLSLTLGDNVELESIDFAVPLAAFFRTT